jgi:chemotaxis signal transduction protein
MKAIVKHQASASSQFLTFLLDEQEYGLELFKIQEIRGYRKRSRINSPGRSVIGEGIISRSVRSVGRIISRQTALSDYHSENIIVIRAKSTNLPPRCTPFGLTPTNRYRPVSQQDRSSRS